MIRLKKDKTHNEIFTKIQDAERFLDVGKSCGLLTIQVARRVGDGLTNTPTKKKGKTYFSIVCGNLFTYFNLVCVLVCVALLSVRDFVDCTFMGVVVANLVVGVFQECRSKYIVDKLSIVSAPTATVVRDGVHVVVPIADVVLDDVMYLASGNQICADSSVIEGAIQVNEALLTGESAMVKKQAGDKLFAGSFIVSGTAFVRVTAVGDANYIENLTSFAKSYKRSGSQLLRSIQRLISIIGVLLIPIAALMFLQNYGYFKIYEPSTALASAIARTAGSVVGMIPSGMFLLTSVALAVGVMKLARGRVLVQDLYAIEMLARTDVLCLDKTGTITDGQMNVCEVTLVSGETRGVPFSEIMSSYLAATRDSNQTAVALINYFGNVTKLKPLEIMPFSSEKKLSAVTFEGEGTYVVGAPEFVLGNLSDEINARIDERTMQGCRVLLVAKSERAIVEDRLPTDLEAVAIISIEDHIRDDANSTIMWFKQNGVAVKVISGDNPVTVSQIAKRAGIDDADKYISLEGIVDGDVIELADKYTVFGRVSPEQKQILVKSLKTKGHTVAMTGDGVNDILALKEADCSVAMAAGAEAARNVSHIVLMDSNFANMPAVVLQGRKIVNNIQKSSSLYTMKTLFSIVLSIVILFMGIVEKVAYPVTPSNLLMLGSFIIGIASFFLTFQPNTDRIKGNFLANLFKETFPNGIALVCSYLAVFAYSKMANVSVADVGSMTVLAITFSGFAMLIRLCQPLNKFRSLLVIGSLIACCAASALSMFFMQDYPTMLFPKMFNIGKLGAKEILYVIAVVILSYALSCGIAMIIKAISFLANGKKRGLIDNGRLTMDK